MEFDGGNVEQGEKEATDWQEAMQGVKFQGAKTFKSGDNEFLIPPTPEAETSEVLKNPGILGTFKNFLAEKFGSKKAGTGLFGLLGKQGANLSSLSGAGAGQEKIKIPGVDDGNEANEAVSDVAESINEIFQNDYTHEVVGQTVDEELRPPIWGVKRVSEKLGSNEGGWNYYSSKNEKVGLEQPIRADGRLYLNAEPMDTYDIAGKFVSACRESGLPYEFKINQFADRADAMVFYIDNGNFDGYFGILNKILAENPQIKKRIGKPPRLTEKVNDVIGYGDENGGMSYNDRMCTKFQTAIEQVSVDQAAVAPSLSVQERAKVLYVNFHEQFITAIQEKLHK